MFTDYNYFLNVMITLTYYIAKYSRLLYRQLQLLWNFMFTDYNYFLNVKLMITLSYYIAKYS